MRRLKLATRPRPPEPAPTGIVVNDHDPILPLVAIACVLVTVGWVALIAKGFGWL